MSSQAGRGTSGATQERRPPEKKDISAATERILHSETFSRCPRLRDFLAFIVDCSIHDRAQEINEYSLGVQIFDRPAHYNPGLDNIVRASARQLRARLADYYAFEGSLDEWRIEIPKGAYVPVWRPAACEAAPETATELSRPALPPLRVRRVTPAVAAAAVCVLISTTVFLEERWHRGSTEEVNLLTPLLSDSRFPLTMVLDDPYLPVLANWSGQSIGLKDYLAKHYQAIPGFPGERGTMLRGAFQQSEITSASTAQLLVKIARNAPRNGQQIQVRHCRDLRVRDLGKGNFIFFGGVGSNPWVELLQKNTNFQNFFEPNGRRGFLNHNPLPNEPKEFAIRDPGDSGKICYARVAIFRNPMGSGQVALIGGTSWLSTEAAGDFALSHSGLAEVRKFCPEASLSPAPAVEVILETTSLAGAPVTARVVARRCGPFKTN